MSTVKGFDPAPLVEAAKKVKEALTIELAWTGGSTPHRLIKDRLRHGHELADLARCDAILAWGASHAALVAEVERLRAALGWYAEQVGRCRKNTSEGDAARSQLDRDAGTRARAAITEAAGDA